MTLFNDETLAALDSSTSDVAHAETLPPEIYTSAEFLEFEREAVFMKEWLAVGRAERLAGEQGTSGGHCQIGGAERARFAGGLQERRARPVHKVHRSTILRAHGKSPKRTQPCG